MAKRLRDEVQGLLKRTPTPGYGDVESLRYLNNFCREVLRVHCPGKHPYQRSPACCGAAEAPVTSIDLHFPTLSSAVTAPREASEDVTIQGVFIPKGTTVVSFASVIQHNPTIWGDDCDEFNPDRWDHLEGSSADPGAFAAFTQGPRSCIGKRMAMLEFKIILVDTVSKFEFEEAHTGDIEILNPSPLLRIKGGLKVRAKRFAA